METKKLKQVKALKSGWSRWEMPVMIGYMMGCCDCLLIHEMEFKVVKTKGKKSNGWIKSDEIKNGRVLMRARRIEK